MGRLRNIGREHLALADIVQMTESDVELAIDADAREAVINCRHYLERRLASGSELFYGINTGFGSQYNVRIDNNRIHQLQHNLILSHAAGAGEKVDSEISRAMLLLKIVKKTVNSVIR